MLQVGRRGERFITASSPVRARRIGKRDHIDTDEAAELLKADDAIRARFVRLFYAADWADTSAYDLVVDTSDCSDADAVAQIVAAVRTLPRTGASARAANLSIDPVLAETVDATMARRAAKA